MANDVMPMAAEPIERVLERLLAAPIFGQPTTAGAVTVIPVSAVTLGFGYGGGSGRGPAGAGEEASGGGGGGGAGGRVEPRGYIKIGPDGVRYEPIIDQTRIALTGILMVAWNVFWIGATIRSAVKKASRS